LNQDFQHKFLRHHSEQVKAQFLAKNLLFNIRQPFQFFCSEFKRPIAEEYDEQLKFATITFQHYMAQFPRSWPRLAMLLLSSRLPIAFKEFECFGEKEISARLPKA
jgi:hypothetical protein